MAVDGNAEQAEYWTELTPSWLAGEQHSQQVSGPFGRRAMDRLDLVAGLRVLDVGCGSGPTTVELARRVAPGGDALGADISAGMVAAAERRAEAAGVANARFITADVQTADLGRGAFDVVFSQFGLMFFNDPDSAFVRIHHALRPGGTLAFTCWQDLFSNEWMFVPGSAAVAVTGVFPAMPGPGEPGPFSLADPERVTQLLGDAGFTEIEVDAVSEAVVLPRADVGSLVELSSQVGPVREALRVADDETRSQVLAAVADALEARIVDDQLSLSAAAHVVTATA